MTDDLKDDEKRRDEVLKRMLATPPKPHDDKSAKSKKISDKGQKERDDGKN